MIGILVVIAIVVWWWVFHPNHGKSNAALNCIPRPEPGLSTADPHKVHVRVYNSTDKSGLAKVASGELKKRGFTVDTTGNDPIRQQRNVQDEGEIRFGTNGAQQALIVSFQFPGIKLVHDSRKDTVVDVALGPSFAHVGTPAAVKQAAKVAETNAKASAKFGKGEC